MIVFNITINIAPEWLDHQLYQERMYQAMKAIKDRESEEQRQAIEDLQAITHKITCSKCGWTGTGYQTPVAQRWGFRAIGGNVVKVKRVTPEEIVLPLDKFQQVEFTAGSTGRPRKHATNAEKQKAYRNRNRVTKCPYCEQSFFHVTGRVQFFSMLESGGGQVYFCPGCNAYITLQAGEPTQWHIMIRPNLGSIRKA